MHVSHFTLKIFLRDLQVEKLRFTKIINLTKSESHSVVPNSLGPQGLLVCEILQARILEWVAFPFSRGSS